MERYKVEFVFDNKSLFVQYVKAKNKRGAEKMFCLRSTLPVKKGMFINMYEKKGIVKTTLAYSYKINGKRIVDLLRCGSVNQFYDGVGFFDSCRLNRDICQALRAQGIKPTLNRKNNLRLFFRALER
jgi:hypothetical protein